MPLKPFDNALFHMYFATLLYSPRQNATCNILVISSLFYLRPFRSRSCTSTIHFNCWTSLQNWKSKTCLSFRTVKILRKHWTKWRNSLYKQKSKCKKKWLNIDSLFFVLNSSLYEYRPVPNVLNFSCSRYLEYAFPQ